MSLHALRASKTFTVFVVCVAVFADILLQNLVVPVLPYALRERVGLTEEEDVQKWSSILLSAFGGAFMGGSFLFGSIVDRLPTRRVPFILGLLLTFASTLCFALGTDLPTLLIARLLEGLSAAVIATAGTALLRDTVGHERLGRAMGFSSMAMSLGLLLGPVIGGVLYEYCGYFETFLPALVLVGVEVGLRCLMIENPKRPRQVKTGEESMEEDATEYAQPNNARPKKDTVENFNHCNEDNDDRELQGEVPPILQTCQNIQHPSSERLIDETQPLLQPEPSVPKQRQNAFLLLLSNGSFATSLLGLFIVSSTLCGFDAVLPPYISAAYDYGPVHVAGLFLCLAVPQLLSPFTGALTDRCGAKRIAAIGFILSVPSLASLALFSKTTAQPMLKLCVSFLCIGTATALVSIPLRVNAAGAVRDLERKNAKAFGPQGAQGRGFGLMNGVAAGGGMVGPLAVGWIRVCIGWAGMAMILSGFCLGLLGCVLIFVKGKSDAEDETEVFEDV